MKTKLFFIALCFLTISCGLLRDTPGYLSGHHKLNDSQKSKIEILDTLLPEKLASSDAILVINGTTLRHYQTTTDTTLVYIWGAKCSSEVCVPLSYVDAYCKSRGYSLVIVAEYYDPIIFEQQWNSKYSLVFIDHFYYAQNKPNKYIPLFLKDVLGKEHTSLATTDDRYYIFKNGVPLFTKKQL